MWVTECGFERQERKPASLRSAEMETPRGCGRNQNRMSVRILD
jgi:hypothetical protein